MDIQSIIEPNRVLHHLECSSKKRLLETIASRLCDHNPALDPGTVFSALIARERLGSTGIGNGIAIPHCRIAGCPNTLGMLVTLKQAIDFDAIDTMPVDVIFVLIVPEDNNKDHLQTLAKLAEVFSDAARLRRIRSAASADELHTLITSTF